MKFLNTKVDKELTRLLKKSAIDFKFDEAKIKNRLLYSLADVPMKAAHNGTVFLRLKIVKYSAGTALVIVFVSSTFAFASNSVPGDRLFALNKFGEHIVLSLPLSVNQNAEFQTYIVSKRLQALQQSNSQTESKTLAAVAESDESLETAINTVTANKLKLETAGNSQAANALNQDLSRLEQLASQHESSLQALEDSSSDDNVKQNIQNHLAQIKKAHSKAQQELNNSKNNSEGSEN